MRDLTRPLTALAIAAAGLLAGHALLTPSAPALAENRPQEHGTFMEVINSGKTNEPLVFIYDEESKRLLMYTTIGGAELKLAAARNLAYDVRIQEYKNQNERGMAVRDLKKAFEDEDREREAKKKEAEEEAKKKAGHP